MLAGISIRDQVNYTRNIFGAINKILKILTRANNNKMIKFVFRPPTTDASIDDIAAAGQ